VGISNTLQERTFVVLTFGLSDAGRLSLDGVFFLELVRLGFQICDLSYNRYLFIIACFIFPSFLPSCSLVYMYRLASYVQITCASTTLMEYCMVSKNATYTPHTRVGIALDHLAYKCRYATIWRPAHPLLRKEETDQESSSNGRFSGGNPATEQRRNISSYHTIRHS